MNLSGIKLVMLDIFVYSFNNDVPAYQRLNSLIHTHLVYLL